MILQSDDGHAEGAVAFVLVADAAGDDVDVGLRLLKGDAGLEADEEVVVFIAAALGGVGAERQREKHVGLVHRAFGGHGFGAEDELRTEHAGDDELVAV